LGEETTDLEKAFELMQAIPQRASDLQYINNIEGYKGNLHKLGRLLKHVLRAKLSSISITFLFFNELLIK
jgi:hypothetical protein